jgi:hypothetical protein
VSAISMYINSMEALRAARFITEAFPPPSPHGESSTLGTPPEMRSFGRGPVVAMRRRDFRFCGIPLVGGCRSGSGSGTQVDIIGSGVRPDRVWWQ